MSWENFGKEKVFFPKAGDRDTFKRTNSPEPEAGYPGKFQVRTAQRLISVFKSQLDPIGKYFAANPTESVVTVDWISEDYTRADMSVSKRTVPVIQDKLPAKKK